MASATVKSLCLDRATAARAAPSEAQKAAAIQIQGLCRPLLNALPNSYGSVRHLDHSGRLHRVPLARSRSAER